METLPLRNLDAHYAVHLCNSTSWTGARDPRAPAAGLRVDFGSSALPSSPCRPLSPPFLPGPGRNGEKRATQQPPQPLVRD